eukprot:2754872-Prymnesium_polylepis.1
MPPKGSGRNPDAVPRPRGIELRAECAVAPAIRIETPAAASVAQPTTGTQHNAPDVWLRTPTGARVRVLGGEPGIPKFCARHGLQEEAIRELLASESGEHRGWRTGESAAEASGASVGELHVRHALERDTKRPFRAVTCAPGSSGDMLQAAVRRKLGIETAVPIEAMEHPGDLLAEPDRGSQLGPALPWDEIASKLVPHSVVRLEVRQQQQ